MKKAQRRPVDSLDLMSVEMMGLPAPSYKISPYFEVERASSVPRITTEDTGEHEEELLSSILLKQNVLRDPLCPLW